MKAYSSCFRNRQHNHDDEEDAFQDISLIIELLSHLLSKDFIDFSENDEGSFLFINLLQNFVESLKKLQILFEINSVRFHFVG